MAFPSVDLGDDGWAKRGPSAFPEMMEGSHTLNPEFGGPMHDRNATPEITTERMHQFSADLQLADDFDDLRHPKPWQRSVRSEESSSLNVKVVRGHPQPCARNTLCVRK